MGADQPLGDELICLGDHRAPVHGFADHDALSGAVVFVDQRDVANRRLELLNARASQAGSSLMCAITKRPPPFSALASWRMLIAGKSATKLRRASSGQPGTRSRQFGPRLTGRTSARRWRIDGTPLTQAIRTDKQE
jgi:hypothetical protein